MWEPSFKLVFNLCWVLYWISFFGLKYKLSPVLSLSTSSCGSKESYRLTHSCVHCSLLSFSTLSNPCIDQSKQIFFSLIILFFTSLVNTNVCNETMAMCMCNRLSNEISKISHNQVVEFRLVACCLRSVTQVLIKRCSAVEPRVWTIKLKLCNLSFSCNQLPMLELKLSWVPNERLIREWKQFFGFCFSLSHKVLRKKLHFVDRKTIFAWAGRV